MFITLDEAKKKIESSRNLVPYRTNHDTETRKDERSFLSGDCTVRPLENGGRRLGDKNLPSFIKEIAATLTTVAPVREISEALEISSSSVNKAKENPVIKSKIQQDLDKIRDLALEKLMRSMNLIADEKLEKSSARDLSTIASNMSKVVEKTMPKEAEENQGTRLILYAPTIRQENHFEVKKVDD